MSLTSVTRDHTAPQTEDWGRRRLRKGAASVAREMRDTGHGIGLGYKAEDMMRGTSRRNLSRMAEGFSPLVITRPLSRWCKICKDAGENPWRSPEPHH